MLETNIENHLVREVTRRGGRCEKWGARGWQDRFVIWPGGRIDFIELKAPGEKPRPLQRKRAEQLQVLGCRVYCLDSKQAVDDYMMEVEQHAL